MRIIARSTISAYAIQHPSAKPSLEHWVLVVRAASWQSTNDVQAAFSTAKVLNGEFVRFEASGNHRMIVAFRFDLGIAFIKFIGTHKEYDRVDALTVSRF